MRSTCAMVLVAMVLLAMVMAAVAGAAGPDSRPAGQAATRPATRPAAAPAATQPLDREAAANLIRQLGDGKFAIRAAATTKLMALGEPVRPMLTEKAQEKDLDPEVGQRIQIILAEFDRLHFVILKGMVGDGRNLPQQDVIVRAHVVDASGRPMVVDPVTTRADGVFMFRLPADARCQWIEAGDADWAGRLDGPFPVKAGEVCQVWTLKLLPVTRGKK